MRTSSRTGQKIQVRVARISDAGRIAALSEQLGYPCSSASVRRRLRYLLEGDKNAIWVAEVDGEAVAGWIHVFVKQVLESDRQLEIGGLIVDKSFRGRGVGKVLVERAERWAKARRLRAVATRSSRLNTPFASLFK
ncbi:MAG: GNAT family N-acetyltransferase [Acidobacteriota bacterium]